MRYLFFFLPCLLNAQTIQLAPPHFDRGNVFFKVKTMVSISFDLEGAAIHYSTQDQVTEQSPIYVQQIQIRESTTVKAMATHPDFAPSEVAEKQFIRVKYRPKEVVLQPQPHESYAGNGAASLHDLTKGSGDLHDGNWLGFLADTVIVDSYFLDKMVCKNLILSTLFDFNSWVLPPREISIFGKNKQDGWQKIGFWKESADFSLGERPKNPYFQKVLLEPLKTKEIRVVILPHGLLPVGHPGAGSPAWLFLDEVLFQ